MPRRVLWAMLAALVVLWPPGAGGGDEESAAARRLAGTARGGVLRVGVAQLTGIDPAQARTVDQLLVADQLFDSLTAADPATLEPVPSLAAAWQASADQTQWDFSLRPGATFSNGRPLTAADVKYSLERVARPGSGSPAADLLQPVSGYVAYRGQAAPELAGVTVTAPDVVHVSLDQPWSAFPSVLSSPVFGVVARESVEGRPPGRAFGLDTVTSGPFRLHGRRGPSIDLRPPPGAGTALGGVELVQVDDVEAGYRAFARGELDWARVPPSEVDDAARRYGRAAFRPYLAELFYGFNLASPKLGDVRFREAIVRGLDRRAIVAAVFHGTVRATDAMVLDGVPGHQPDACPRCAHDPARARALVAEAFAGATPPEVGLDYDQDEGQDAIARSMQASLREAGITLTLRPKAVGEYDDFAASGQQEMFRLGWIAPYPSADAFLAPLFATRSPNNLTGFSSPVVDDALRAARAEADGARRVELYRQAERAVMDQVPVVPLGQFHLQAVVSKRVRHLRVTSLGTFDASVVRLRGGR